MQSFKLKSTCICKKDKFIRNIYDGHLDFPMKFDEFQTIFLQNVHNVFETFFFMP